MPDHRPTRPRWRWGSGYTNELIVRVPLDEAVAWGEPSEGSEFGMTKGGVEDAWVEAYDYFLAGAARHIPTADVVSLPPATGWEGAAGWDAFLQWMREKNVARFYPDGRNLLDSPKMNADADSNGVVDFFTGGDGALGASAVYSFDAVEQAQKLTVSGNTTGATRFPSATQRIYGIRPGDSIAGSVEMKLTLSGGATAYVQLQWQDAGLVTILQSTASPFTNTSYQRNSVAAVAPANAVSVLLTLGITVPVGATATAWWRNAMMQRASTASAAFIDNPGYEECYLVEPMRGAPSLESSLRRRVDLVFRNKARHAFAGY